MYSRGWGAVGVLGRGIACLVRLRERFGQEVLVEPADHPLRNVGIINSPQRQ